MVPCRNLDLSSKRRCPFLRAAAAGLAVIFVSVSFGMGRHGDLAAEEAPSASVRYRSASRHPPVALLDAEGNGVLDRAGPVSPMRSCGGCHDTAFIATHHYHAGFDGAWIDPASAPRVRTLLDGSAMQSLDLASFLERHGGIHVGGGPAGALGSELDCFLCHLGTPDVDARSRELARGRARWAPTATLAKTGLVERDGETWNWRREAFAADGTVKLAFGNPSSDRCGTCHGLVYDGADPLAFPSLGQGLQGPWQSLTSGQVYSPQRMRDSAMNFEGKRGLSRAWDLHAERLLECTHCHPSVNNPAYYVEASRSRPSHLAFDGRRLDATEYLQRPRHEFARGTGSQESVAPQVSGTMRRCEGCHDAAAVHPWLPYRERHTTRLACEACHVPVGFAPALEQVDRTVLTQEGKPIVFHRGVDGASGSSATFLRGFRPVLLSKTDAAGTRLVPHNLVAEWYWTAGEPARRVSEDELRAALLDGSKHHPDILRVLDTDRDGSLSEAELSLDEAPKVRAVALRLEAGGLSKPKIEARIVSFGIHHGAVSGSFATKACGDCHGAASRLAEPFPIARRVPGGVVPELPRDSRVAFSGRLVRGSGGALIYEPDPGNDGLHVLGHGRWPAVDALGAVLLAFVLLGAAAHGSARVLSARRRRGTGARPAGEIRKEVP